VRYIFAVAALSFLLVAQCVLSMVQESAVFDEPAHLPAGYSYLVMGDFRMNPEHPPLTKMIAAAPLLFMKLRSPAEFASWQERDSYSFGIEYLYRSGQDADKILFWGRFSMVMVSLALGLLVFFWTRAIAGPAAGLFSLFLYVLCPNIIAYSKVVVPDMGAALFMSLTIFCLWKYLERRRFWRLIIVAAGLGLSVLSKFNMLCLVPAIFVIVFMNARGSLRTRAASSLKIVFIICLVAVTVIWAGYLFEYGPALEHRMHATLNVLTRSLPGWAGRIIVFIAENVKVPFPTLFNGLGWLMVPTSIGRDSFLMGHLMRRGPWYGNELAFLMKTPVPFLILLALALYRVVRDRLYADARYYTLLIAVLAVVAADMLSRFSIQVKYVLSVYPFFIVLIGSAFDWRALQRRAWKILFASLSLWYAAGTVLIFPHYLAYFNEIVGGPENGYRCLAASNLDWGQGLKMLKRYIDEQGIGRIRLAYFGTADPRYYGIEYDELPPDSPQKGWIAVSATYLQGAHTKRGGYDWLKRYSPCAKIGYSIFVYNIL